jgi:RNA polymerase sigma-70 factor (ECF subfamily)
MYSPVRVERHVVSCGDPIRSALIPGNKSDGCRVIPLKRSPATRRTGLDASELGRFEAIVLPHLDAAYTLARYLTRHEQDAQDVVQDACLRALKYFDGFRGGDGRAWVLAIVRNTAFTRRRRHRLETSAAEFDEQLHSDAVADLNPEAALAGSAARESLHQALDRLPAEFREVIVLRELQGLSYKEIGEVTGVPVGTVMSRLSRARLRLQRALYAEQEGHST